MNKKIRVLLVEDEFIVGEAIATLLQMEATITVVGHAHTAEMCLQTARAMRPDVILLDLRLPDQPGIKVVEALLQEIPDVRVVLLTGYADDQEVAAAFRVGAVGCVLKSQPFHELVQAIQRAFHGDTIVPPSVAKVMLQMFNPSKRKKDPISVLSEAEKKVLVLVAQGLENKEIARQLRVRRPTVHAHISHILTKLHLENRTQAAVFAVRHGLVSLTEQRSASSDAVLYGYPNVEVVNRERFTW